MTHTPLTRAERMAHGRILLDLDARKRLECPTTCGGPKVCNLRPFLCTGRPGPMSSRRSKPRTAGSIILIACAVAAWLACVACWLGTLA